jgi:chromate reductase, NAD(P)H dehydrogenase (quinone)
MSGGVPDVASVDRADHGRQRQTVANRTHALADCQKMNVDSPRLLLVSGSTRNGSTNTAALRTLRGLAAARDVEATLFEEMTRLPHFDPDDDDGACLPPAVDELRWAIGDADAVVFCTPEYAGALPGAFKNLLDWTVGGVEMYRKPVAWINVAAEGRGEAAQASLSTVLGYLGSDVIEAACMRIPVARSAVAGRGVIDDDGILGRLSELLDALLAHLAAD